MSTKTNTDINGYKYYRISRTVGHTIKDGKKIPVIKQFCGSSKGDAERKYNEYLKDQAAAKYTKEYSNDIATLHDRSKEYIENVLSVSQKYSNGTKIRYESAYNVHVKGTWIDILPVSRIKATDVQRFYNEMDVSMATLEQVNRYMHALYKWMVRNDYASDVIEAIELPIKKDTTKSEDIEVWDDKYWDMLTSQNFSLRHDLLIKLLCYAGLRIGEALGLKYSDIRDGMIHINRQYSMGEIKDPKYKSNRDIPVHDKVAEALLDHKEWHRKEMKVNGYKTDYIFTTKSGSLYDYQNIARAFKRMYRKNGIPYMKFHAYRSTFCTKLCEAGVPLEVASKLLGHKSLEVTAKHYALVRNPTKIDAISKLK